MTSSESVETKRSYFQFRPITHNPGALYYSPQRDLAYIGIPTLAYAIDYVLHCYAHPNTDFLHYITKHDITQEELLQAVGYLEESLIARIQGEKVPEDPFLKVRFPVRLLIHYGFSTLLLRETVESRKDVLSEEEILDKDPEHFIERCLGKTWKTFKDRMGQPHETPLTQIRRTLRLLWDKLAVYIGKVTTGIKDRR